MPSNELFAAPVSSQVGFQDLQVHQLLRHAASVHGQQRVHCLDAEGGTQTLSYAELDRQADAAAQELQRLGLGLGDAIGHLSVSSIAQLARLYGAWRLGVVTHLLNPQHEPTQLATLCTALHLRGLWHDAASTVLARGLASDLPRWPMEAALPPARAWVADPVPEQSLSHVCYSSGTTGLPKSASYSHRSTVLHAWACALPDALGLSTSDRVMPLMQLFHASAWGAPFVCPMVGAELLLVPPSRDPAQWYCWIEDQGVTVLGAVSAHWQTLAAYVQARGLRFSTLQRTVVGGTRLPTPVADYITQALGVEVRHAWGMTETSPLATVERHQAGRTLMHGRPVFGVECAVQADPECPAGSGELLVRGHWVTRGPSANGDWLHTGDRAAWQADGRLQVLDRMADALRPASTGGRTISTAEVEHLCRGPDVKDAALVVLDNGRSALALVLADNVPAQRCLEAVRERISQACSGWQPDHLLVQHQLPYTASAKVLKRRLARELAQALAARPTP